MIKFILEHESYIRKLLAGDENQDWEKVRKYHKAQIMFLQHERLVHMLVTLFFGFLFGCIFFMAIFLKLVALFFLVLVFGIFEVFYLVHLYRLETGVQRWYGLYRDIVNRIG